MFLSIKEFATLIFLKGFQINVKSKHLLEIPEQGHICPEKATIFSGKKSFWGGIIMMHIFVHFPWLDGVGATQFIIMKGCYLYDLWP